MIMNMLNKLIQDKESMTKAVAIVLLVSLIIFIITSSTALIAQNQITHGTNETNTSNYTYECIVNEDCDDNEIITIDICHNNQCHHEFGETELTNESNETNQTLPIVEPECSTAEDCDDNNESTIDLCIEGNCTHEEIEPSQNQTNETIPFILIIEDYDGDKVYSQISLYNKLEKKWKKLDKEATIEKGKHNVKIKLTQKIKEIEIDSLEINETKEYKLKIDTTVPLKKTPGAVDIYAIDPTALNFTEAIVTATAKGSELWKCKEWDFDSRECEGEWIRLMDIVPGEDYSFTLTPEDPAFVETSEAVDVSIAPIDNTTFVVAWVDRAEADVSFKIMNTNGTTIVNTIDVDTTVDTQSRVSVSAINSTHFAIAWVDGPEDDITRAIYDINGNNVFSATDVDPAVRDNTDVSVTQLGDRFVVCYANDDDNNADFQIFYNNGSQAVGETFVDDSILPQATLQNLISCTGVNSTRWVYFWFDDDDNDATYFIGNQSGGAVDSVVDIDTNVGETGQVAVAGLDGNKFAMVWYDSTDDDITIAIRYINGTVILNPTDIDTNAGTESRVAVAAVRRNSTDTIDSFVVAWWNQNSADIKAAVYNNTGSPITAPFTVETQQDTTYRLLDVAARDPITNNSLCPGTFIVAYTNLSDQGIFKGYYVNGTEWNGVCAPPNQAPQISLNLPANNTQFNNTQNINFNFTATDDQNLTLNCSIYLDSVLNQTNSSTANNTLTNFLINGISYGSHNWSINCSDGSLSNVSEIWFFIINDTIAPNITSITTNPTFPYYNNGTSQNITVNFTSSEYPINVTFNLYYPNGTIANTQGPSQVNNSGELPINYTLPTGLPDGNYTLNMTVNDSAGNLNITFLGVIVIDTLNPNIYFNPNTDANGTYSKNWIFVNVTATDLNLAAVIFEWNGANETFDNSAGNLYWENKTGLADGNYLFKAYANDSAGNYNATEQRNVTLDTTAPNVTLNSPGNGLVTGNATITFNCSAQDATNLANITLWHNASGWQANETQAVSGTSNSTNFTKTFTQGTYKWSCSACDALGHCNNSFAENRTFTIDLNAPSITYVSPTDVNNAYVSRLWTYINITVDDPNNVSVCILEWDGANESMIMVGSGTSVSCYKNKSDIETIHSYNVYANDSLNNFGAGGQRNVTFDITTPTITGVNAIGITSNAATIIWTTDENANSTVNYGKTLALGSSQGSGSFVTNHTITLSSLSASTLYYYNVTSCDQAGNCNTSGYYNFTTLASGGGGGGGGGGEAGGGGKGYPPLFPPETHIDKNPCYMTRLEPDRIDSCIVNIYQTIYFTYKGIEHAIKIDEINSNSIKITILSEPIKSALLTNETKEIDLDSDGTKDISVTLENIDSSNRYDTKATITVRIIAQGCICPQCSEWSSCFEGKQTRTCYNCSNETNYICQEVREDRFCMEKPRIALWWFFLLLLLVLILLALLIIALKRRKNKKEQYGYKKEINKSLKESHKSAPVEKIVKVSQIKPVKPLKPTGPTGAVKLPAAPMPSTTSIIQSIQTHYPQKETSVKIEGVTNDKIKLVKAADKLIEGLELKERGFLDRGKATGFKEQSTKMTRDDILKELKKAYG